MYIVYSVLWIRVFCNNANAVYNIKLVTWYQHWTEILLSMPLHYFNANKKIAHKNAMSELNIDMNQLYSIVVNIKSSILKIEISAIISHELLHI